MARIHLNQKGKILYYLHCQFNISRASFTLEYMPRAINRRRGPQRREMVDNVCFSLKLFAPGITMGFLTKFAKIWALKVLFQNENKRQNAVVCDPTILLFSLFLNEWLWPPVYSILGFYRRCHGIQYCPWSCSFRSPWAVWDSWCSL